MYVFALVMNVCGFKIVRFSTQPHKRCSQPQLFSFLFNALFAPQMNFSHKTSIFAFSIFFPFGILSLLPFFLLICFEKCFSPPQLWPQRFIINVLNHNFRSQVVSCGSLLFISVYLLLQTHIKSVVKALTHTYTYKD